MSANTANLERIKQMFEDQSIRHKMINGFGFGPSYNISNEPILFPYLWLEPVNSRTAHSVNSGAVEYYTFNMYVMDKINKGDPNYLQTSSDCDYISKTILADLDQNYYYIDNDWSIDGDITSEPVYEQTEDNANGYMTTFTLKLPMRYTPCNIPMVPIQGYTVSLAQNIVEYRLVGATGPQGPIGPTGPQGDTGGTGSFSGASIQMASGEVLGASFSGTPLSYLVNLPGSFNEYIVTLDSYEIRDWSTLNETSTSFTIESNSSTSFTYSVKWSAIEMITGTFGAFQGATGPTGPAGGSGVIGGVILAASFSGVPLYYPVTFSTPYTGDYSINVLGYDLRNWSISTHSSTGFIVESNSTTPLLGQTMWSTNLIL